MNVPHYGPHHGPPYGHPGYGPPGYGPPGYGPPPPPGPPPGYGPPPGPPPAGPAPQIDLDAILTESLDEARMHLRVILNTDVTQLGGDKLAYSVNAGLTAMIVRRTPDRDRSLVLDKSHTRRWNTTKRDLWTTALRNMVYEPIEVQTHDTNADTPVHVVQGAGWPGASHVMRLPEIVREPMPYGAIVMLPTSNTMVYAVLRSRRSLPLIPFLYRTSTALVGGEPFVDQLLWWRDGNVNGMSVRPDPGGGVQVRQSEEFTFLLDHELPEY
ncbi:hypothetical protein [Nocardiopsis trehalosi]|uniref:hypothetical protein n=1 Tax=Nocardiopsis trehalosi TaxID=109329 RepID=UPI00082B7C59|nr:hypothetical protein [Nocardiopsis trehalosi]